MNKIEKVIEEKENNKILDQTIALEFIRQHTDLYDKKLENRFSEIIAELVNDKIEEYQTKLLKVVIEEIEGCDLNKVGDSEAAKKQIINLIKKSIK